MFKVNNKNTIFDFEQVKVSCGAKVYPEEQIGLIMMDAFKGQDNEEITKFYCENNFALIIVPHTFTNKFQPLDNTLNKPANKFIKGKYNLSCAEQVTSQLNEGKVTVTVSLNLLQVKHCMLSATAQQMKFSIKDFFSKCDHIRRKLQIWSLLQKKSLMKNFIFYAVWIFEMCKCLVGCNHLVSNGSNSVMTKVPTI